MSGFLMINGRCEDCLGEDHDSAMCGCWCHDTYPDCGRAECTGEDCYWPEDAGLNHDEWTGLREARGEYR